MRNTGWIVAVVLVVVLAVLLLGGAGMMGLGGFGMMGLGYGMMGGRGMMNGYGGMMNGYGLQGFGYSPLGGILMLVFWALIIIGIVLLVVWLVRNAGRTFVPAAVSDPALDVLKARYARGEITKEQFDAIKRDLEV